MAARLKFKPKNENGKTLAQIRSSKNEFPQVQVAKKKKDPKDMHHALRTTGSRRRDTRTAAALQQQ